MKSTFQHHFLAMLLCVAFTAEVHAQNSSFTYQGQLTANGSPANGIYDLRFTIYDSSGGPTVVAGPITNSPTTVSNGLFTATLDFGAGAFDGNPRWLEIAARTSGGGTFSTLTPRQAVTATPYALFADSASDALNATTAVTANSATTATSATTAATANNFSGSLSGDVTGTQGATVVSLVGGATAANVAGGANAANAATSANTANAIVKRDASGNFSAGTITANLSGNATTATTATNVTGNIADSQLSGNVTRLNGTNVFTGTNRFSAVVLATNANNVIAGTFSGNGNGVTNLSASQLTGTIADALLSGNVSLFGAAIDSSEITDGTITTNDLSTSVLNSTFWKLGGNTGANPTNGDFLGTADNQPLEFRVNGQRGLRLEYANDGTYQSVNIVGGYSGNSAGSSFVGGTISGGGRASLPNQVASSYGTIGGGLGNVVQAGGATIGGGSINLATGNSATIGGGYGNTASGNAPTIGGGTLNAATGNQATVGGGNENSASGDEAAVGGGELNFATGNWATVGGGKDNVASGTYAVIPGGNGNVATNNAFAAGHRAQAGHIGAFVWADSQDSDFFSTSDNQFNVRAGGGVRFITSGAGATLDGMPLFSGLNGSTLTNLSASNLTGTVPNAQLGASVSLLGQSIDSSEITDGAITTNDLSASVLNGTFWKVGGNGGTSPGTQFLGTTDNQPLEFKVNNQRGLRLQPGLTSGSGIPNIIVGNALNFVSPELEGAVIAGGGANVAGQQNSISTNGNFAVISGGRINSANGFYAVVAGGSNNRASATGSTVGGGDSNFAEGDGGTVGGGLGNVAGAYAAVPGGRLNVASNFYSFAAGRRAKALHAGSFVWADSDGFSLLGADFASTGNDQFLIRASGGVAIGTNDPAGAALCVAGSIKADTYLGMGSTLMLGTTDNQPLEFKVNNQRGLRLEYANDGTESINVIGGFGGNFVSNGVVGGTIAGGGDLGHTNKVTANFATVSGGQANHAGAKVATVGGGLENDALGYGATVSGGQNNTASESYATVGGGIFNTASGYTATVGGGELNVADGDYATIPGGDSNSATNNAFAAGHRAKANHTGAFVWADSQNADFASATTDEFNIRAQGGVRIQSDKGIHLSPANGVPMIVRDWDVFGSTAPVEKAGVGRWGLFQEFQNLTLGIPDDFTSFFQVAKYNTNGTATRLFSVDRNGNVGIGTISPASRLHIKQSVDGSGFSDSTGGIRLERAGATSYWQIENWSDNDLSFRHSGGAAFFYMSDTGGTISIASDRNLKKDIEPLSPMLDRVLALKPVSFRYKPVAETEPATLGFVAQDVEEVLPALVGQKGEYKTLNLDGLIPVSVAAIQELNEKLESGKQKAEAQIEELKAENSELKARLEKLEQLVSQKFSGKM